LRGKASPFLISNCHLLFYSDRIHKGSRFTHAQVANSAAEHLPAVEAVPYLTLKAVYSRSQASAEALAAASRSPTSVTVYFDSPAVEGKTLEDLLRRDDVEAVIVALPILHQPAVIEQALRAGKHVLSEKPVAGTVADAVRLIGWYEGNEKKSLWGVAENWRYLESLRYAAQRVRKLGGDLLNFRLHWYAYMSQENKYYNTECECLFPYSIRFCI